MSSEITGEKVVNSEIGQVPSPPVEKRSNEEQQLEHVKTSSLNLVYNDDEEEPEIHARTWIALAAMFLLNFVQVVALQGPPAVLDYIGADLNNKVAQTWVPNALSLVQAVVAPIISSASDTFQARKLLLVGPAILSFIGAAIAPGSTNIYRLIGAQILIGFGFATVPLAYVVPSEILPRKWRPMAQACMNVAAALGSCCGPLIIGGLTKANQHTGWRKFYWIQMAIWGATATGLFFGYRPPKRHTRFDHLSFLQKLRILDLSGCGLLTAGLTLLLTGLNLGGGLFAWTSPKVLGPLIVGIITLLAFCLYEWKFTKTGILHHELFRGGKNRGRTFALCLGLIFVEGIILFAYVIFYPVLTTSLFTQDPFLEVARAQPAWICGGLSTVVYGFASTKFKTIRGPICVGFAIMTGGLVGLATTQPGDSTRVIVFSGLVGLGFGAPLALIIAGVQLSTPHHLIATATALTTSTRAVAVAMFTAIYSAVVNNRLNNYIPSYVAPAAIRAGLPITSVPAFVGALAADENAALLEVPGITPLVILSGVTALKQAFADGLRVVFIIAAPFGAAACVACFFLGDLKSVMNYHVDAPLEELHAKHHREDGGLKV
ncbi:putative siderophore iron transporter [Stipitochalara longipes BDJ]|nr:putative siderophore iron transporter [Stipitochalara longipes BDJ]